MDSAALGDEQTAAICPRLRLVTQRIATVFQITLGHPKLPKGTHDGKLGAPHCCLWKDRFADSLPTGNIDTIAVLGYPHAIRRKPKRFPQWLIETSIRAVDLVGDSNKAARPAVDNEANGPSPGTDTR